LKLKSTSTFVGDDGSMPIEPPALTPKPAFSSLDRVSLVPTLATPTTVSPTSATEQEHQQQNDQYGFHTIVPHL
jgi:hypothetical protein